MHRDACNTRPIGDDEHADQYDHPQADADRQKPPRADTRAISAPRVTPVLYLLALGDEVGQLALLVELAAEILLAIHARVGGTGDM